MKTRIAAVALVALLALTGCAGTVAPEEAPVVATESGSAEPLTAETSTAEPQESDAEAAFLVEVSEALPEETSIPDASDEQLLEAGWSACEMIRAGTDPGDVRLVDGEQPNGADIYADSSAIMNTALLTLCPELV